MEEMTILEAVEYLIQNDIPKRGELADKKEYGEIRTMKSQAKRGKVGTDRFMRFAEKYAPGKYTPIPAKIRVNE